MKKPLIHTHWEKIGKKQRHGICVHLSALRSEKSSGIGEFLDLIPLIDWCQSVGFDCIQLLALNDSGPDPSPYNAISSIALDPIYLRLDDAPHEELLALNQTKRVQRLEVLQKKLSLLKNQYRAFQPDAAFKQFVETHPWLKPYAAFKAYKARFNDIHWKDWPQKLEKPTPKEEGFYLYLQYLCFCQMKQVKAYAAQKNVLLIGDIPILLNPDSADVFSEPHLFDLSKSAGAPPDFYNREGQNWGFPLFNRKALKKENFHWWKRRLHFCEHFYDCYRIDHVIGLFRIWGIDKGDKPAQGKFYPPEKSKWAKNGSEILTMMLQSSSMLPIAEDLGTLTKEIEMTLKKMHIPSTNLIVQMRKRRGRGPYIPFNRYPKNALSTLSTHDSPPIDLWWQKYPEEAALFSQFIKIPYTPFLKSTIKEKIFSLAHQTPSLFHINLLQEYFFLEKGLTWPNLEDERINRPGIVSFTNWTYRYRLSIEEFTSNSKLKSKIKKILKY